MEKQGNLKAKANSFLDGSKSSPWLLWLDGNETHEEIQDKFETECIGYAGIAFFCIYGLIGTIAQNPESVNTIRVAYESVRNLF